MRLLTELLMVVCAGTWCLADNILVFLLLQIRSHYIQVEPIFHALALRGHNVTEVSPYQPKKRIPNLQHIFLSIETFAKWIDRINLVETAQSGRRAGVSSSILRKTTADKVVQEVLKSSVFHSLTHSDNNFDVIFTELFMCQEALVVLGHIFKAPVVTYFSSSYTIDILRLSGAQNSAAYLPERFDNYYDQAGPLSFLNRIDVAWTHLSVMLYNEYWCYPEHDILLSKYISGPLPRISDMLRNILIFFLTSHTVIDGAKLYPPHVIEISGLHLKDPEPLDTGLKKILDTSTRGVIFVSFGTILKTSQIPEEAVRAFLTVFKELDQTVLWKTELNVSVWEIPQNVYVSNWFNQIGILAHPNCVLFLTHGGISSMMEAIRYPVPMIGMPFFADQDMNVANLVYYGYGLRVLYKNLTSKSLLWAIKTTLEDPRYKEKITEASKIFTDKPMSSLDTAVYWIEYVTRHKGAHHLKPLTVQMSWYKVFLLDIIALCIFVFLASSLLIGIPVVLLWRKVRK